MRYNYINSEKARQDILEIGNNLAEYVEKHKIPSIMFIDRSARAAYWAFRYAWLNKFPDKQVPQGYFTNPKGYQAKRVLAAIKEFDETYSLLAQNKDKQVLLVDTCLHTGKTLERMLKVLTQARYEKVSVALTQPRQPYYNRGIMGRKVNVDFTATTSQHECLLFSLDWFVEKESSLVSRAYRGQERQHGRNIRKEIKNIFKLKK
jgi:hypothetical protein